MIINISIVHCPSQNLRIFCEYQILKYLHVIFIPNPSILNNHRAHHYTYVFQKFVMHFAYIENRYAFQQFSSFFWKKKNQRNLLFVVQICLLHKKMKCLEFSEKKKLFVGFKHMRIEISLPIVILISGIVHPDAEKESGICRQNLISKKYFKQHKKIRKKIKTRKREINWEEKLLHELLCRRTKSLRCDQIKCRILPFRFGIKVNAWGSIYHLKWWQIQYIDSCSL